MCANEKERKTKVYHNHTCQRETRCHKNSWLPAIFFLSPLVWNETVCYAEAENKTDFKTPAEMPAHCKGRLSTGMQKVIVVSKTHLIWGSRIMRNIFIINTAGPNAGAVSAADNARHGADKGSPVRRQKPRRRPASAAPSTSKKKKSHHKTMPIYCVITLPYFPMRTASFVRRIQNLYRAGK